jgi:hypothetical protein
MAGTAFHHGIPSSAEYIVANGSRCMVQAEAVVGGRFSVATEMMLRLLQLEHAADTPVGECSVNMHMAKCTSQAMLVASEQSAL